MKILIVEDEPAARQLLTTFLEEEGHAVCCTSTCAGAARLLAGESPELVLLDIDLGEMELSGLDVARLMKNDPDWSQIPIVVTSAMPSAEIRSRASENVFEGLHCIMLGKPIDLDKLLDLIHRHERVR
jgi:CheY-like chemotaxis protein